jgi:hypothetical protein
MQPRVFANPGLAAYKPPPATRLIPLPRKMDAPKLVESPAAPPDNSSTQPDAPQRTTSKAAVASHPASARRAKSKSQHVDDATSAYAYSDRWGYGEHRSYADRTDRGWPSWRSGWNERW